MRVNLSNLLELLGAVLLSVAALAWDWRAFVALVGAALLAVSLVIDDPEPDEPAT